MFSQLINLVRVRQWYKNAVVFLPLLFADKLFDYPSVQLAVLGFVALCLVYGAIYIFNDYFDLEKDRKHADRKKRPLASGQISVKFASFIAALLLLSGLLLAYFLSEKFFALVLLVIGINILYTLYLKKLLFVDVLIIAILLVLRAVAGTELLVVAMSPWLLLCTFLLALFLAIAKRRSDLDDFVNHYRKGELYSIQELDLLLSISLCALLVSYSIYSFFTQAHSWIFWLSVPVTFFIGFRFLHLTLFYHPISLKAEAVFYETQIVAAMALWAIIVVLGIYFR